MVQAGGETQDHIHTSTVPCKKRSKTPGSLCHPQSGSYDNTVYLTSIVEDQNSHYETWIHFSHVSTPLVVREREQRERKLDWTINDKVEESAAATLRKGDRSPFHSCPSRSTTSERMSLTSAPL